MRDERFNEKPRGGALELRRHRLLALCAAALCTALFALAFLVAPRACEGGLAVYFCSGVGVVIALLIIPFVLERTLPLFTRMLVSFGLGALGAAVWTGGLFAANVSILCRLF